MMMGKKERNEEVVCEDDRYRKVDKNWEKRSRLQELRKAQQENRQLLSFQERLEVMLVEAEYLNIDEDRRKELLHRLERTFRVVNG